MYSRAYYNGMINALRGAYNDYRKLGWLTWLFRLHGERMMRAHLHHVVKKCSAFFRDYMHSMPGNELNEFSENLTTITTYAVNWGRLRP